MKCNTRIASAFFPVVACLFGVASLPAQPLTTLDYKVTGQVMQVTPAVLSVPKGIPGSIGVSIPGETPNGSFVEATLRGPSFPARRLVGAVNAPLMLPPLNLAGDYSLDGIRLVSSTGETVLEGSPSTVPVRVFDEVLVSRVTSRPLSFSEIEGRGIEIDDSNFRAVEFEVGFVVDGKTIPVKFPVIAPNFNQSTEIIPVAELEERLAQAELINQQLSETVKLPGELETVMPQIQIKGINMQFANGGEDADLALKIPPIPALMVIPGNIGFLNQFFSVQIFTENAAPVGSGLSVHSLKAELVLPTGADKIAGDATAPGDDPLRFARVNGSIQNIVAVRASGPDGKSGTSDDIERLQPGDTGQGELLVEGLQEGLHVMDLKLSAKLEGLAAGAVEITGKAAGSILVRNPKFSMAFTHPRTVRFGEPYDAVVTILNTSSTVANLVSVELNANNVSGGLLESPDRVDLGNIAPGETRSATFRVRSQKTGAITFSNLTTSDDSVLGRFRLKTGVDERGVELSPDTLLLPDFVEHLPSPPVAAAQRMLGQALGTATAGQLPAGVLRVSKAFIRQKAVELAEAGQRVRYGEPLSRVLPDLLLDWQGARDFSDGWDQLLRETDAGREWREALMLAMEQTNPAPDPAVTRLVNRSRDLAGRGEAWWIAASDRGSIELSYRGTGGKSVDATRSGVSKTATYGGAGGDWLAAAEPGVFVWKMAEVLSGDGLFSLARIGSDGKARELLWRVGDLPAGACVIYDANGGGETAGVDENGDGTPERTVAAQGTDFTELPPQVLMVRQDAEVHVGRPKKPCPKPTTTNDLGKTVNIQNYANVVAVLFSKPMTQDTANVPSAYSLENGNQAAFVQVQPGGRVALVTMRAPLGGLIPRTMTVAAGVKDVRGNALAVAPIPVESLLLEGVKIKGRVLRADGSFAANVPVTLTYNDSVDTALFGCEPWIRRSAQVRSDATGAFDFDFVIGGIGYTVSTTDTSGLSDDAVDLILGSAVKSEVNAAKLSELAALHPDTLLASFAAGAMPEAIAKAEGLDRALVNDLALDDRFASESFYALRFRGRGTVTGQVVLVDGTTPVTGAAVNLFPDVNSRELGRGILTDTAGRFAFFGVPLGPFSIEATTPTGLTRTVSGIVSQNGETVELTVSLGATPPSYSDWQGRLVEPDGTAVAGAPVFIAQGEVPADASTKGIVVLGRATTNESGYWSITRVPVGTYTAVAFSLDGKRKGTRGPLTSLSNVTTTANIVLQSRAVVEGVVQFANGDPVAGAIVGGGDALVTTDTLGRFTLKGVPTGTGRQISAGFVALENSPDPRKNLTRLEGVSLNVQASDNFAVIRFPAQGRIIGQVLDEAGVAVPNVDVAIPYPGGDQPFFLWVRADAKGRYEFPGLPLIGPINSAYDLSAPAPPVAEPFDGDAAAEALKSASSAEVAAIIGKAFTAFTGVNDPLLNGDGDNFNPKQWGFVKSVNLDFDGETEVADIRYTPTSNVSGVVKNGQGVPIGARVRLTGVGPSNIGQPTFVTRSEKNSDPALGTFEFTGDSFIGDWGLQAASPFFPTVISTSGRTTSLNPDVTGVVLQFPSVRETNGSLTGRILLPDGSPAGANVEVSITVPGDDPRVLRTDAQGGFTTGASLFSLRGNTGYQVTAFDPATGGRAQGSIQVIAAQDNQISLTLLGRGSAEVLVLKADGSPASGATVEILGGQFPRDSADGVTNANGRMVFPNLYQGPYGVSASMTVGLTRVAGRAGVLVSLNETASTTIRLSATATITGTFVASDGVTPISFANVRLGSFAYAPTDSNGRFTFADVPLGSHVLTAVDPVTGRGGNVTVSLTLANETRDVRIVETSLGTVSGLVLNAEGTGTAPNAEVELTVDDAFALTRNFKVTSGPDGAYSIAGVPAGTFFVRADGVLPNGAKSGDSGSVRATLPPGATSLRVDVPFAPRASIIAQVFESDGTTPAANATATLSDGANFVRVLDADTQGRVTFSRLPMGNYSITAISRTAGQTHNRTSAAFVSLSDRGQEASVSLSMRGVGGVSGVVFQADGTTPAPGSEVQLEIRNSTIASPGVPFGSAADPVSQYTESVVVGTNGAFSFANVPVGLSVRLSAKLLGLAAAETVDTVAVAQVTTRNLILTASGTIVGRMLREDGTSIASGTEVSVQFPSRSGLQGAIVQIAGTDGKFSLTPIPQGTWTLSAADGPHGGIAFRSGDIAANGEIDDLGDVVLDETAPTVIATNPLSTTENVDIHSSVEVTFSEPLKSSSINSTGVFVRPASGGPAVAATVSQPAPNVVRIAPAAPLLSSTAYQIIAVDGDLRNAVNVITNRGPRDLVDRPLGTLFTATFITRDQRPPVLLSFTPASGSEQVDPRTPLRLSFDEPVQPGAIITLTGPGGPIAGTTTLGVNNLVLTFVPTVDLPVNAILTASVSGVMDLAGNAAINQPLVTTFATLDTLGPNIAQLRIKNAVSPTAGAAITLQAVLTTAEAGVRYRLSADAVTIGTSAADGLEVPFTLPQTGTVVFRGVAIDRFGNEGPLAELIVNVLPNTPPTISLTRINPASGPVLTGSAVSVRVSATDDSSVSQLKAAMTGAATAALSESTGTDLTLTAVVKSTAGSDETITVVAQATDSSGAGTGEQTFTLPISDGTAPTLVLDGAAPVGPFAPGETISIPVRGQDNFGVTRYTLAATGAFTAGNEVLLDTSSKNDARVLTLVVPENAPVSGEIFAIALRGEDAAGLNSAPLTLNLNMVDQTAPIIISSSIIDRSIGQSVSPPLTLSANEKLDPTSVTTTTVKLVRQSDGFVVTASVALNAAGTTITLTPASLPIELNTTYRLIATTGVKDLAGNALAADSGPVFTTHDFRISSPIAETQVVEGQQLTVTVSETSPFGMSVRMSLNGVAQPPDASGDAMISKVVTIPSLADVPGGNLSIVAVGSIFSSSAGTAETSVIVRGANEDSDGDGLLNSQEIATGSDPFRSDADQDPDNDGLTNAQEIAAGTKGNDIDSDDDFLNDGAELAATTNPLDPDTDDDQIPDGRESLFSTNPKLADTDGDTLSDGFEVGFGRYSIMATGFTWELAKADAVSRGGHLLTVVSAKEQTAVEAVLGTAISAQNRWLGYSDGPVEGSFRWVTGELSNFQRFISGEPNNGDAVSNEDAAFIRTDGSWGDIAASNNFSYVLETGYFTDPILTDTDGDGMRDDLDDFIGTPNSSPVAAADSFFVNSGEARMLVISADLLGNDSDNNNDPFVLSSFTQPFMGGSVSQPNSAALLFTPDPGFEGIATFTYTITDAGGLTASARVSITVGPNTRPVAGTASGAGANFALRFDGADDFVQSTLNATQNLAGSPWTIEAWVKPEAFSHGAFPTIYSQGAWRASVGIHNTTGQFDSRMNNAGQLNSTPTPPLNAWTHVAVTFDGTTRKFIVDGVDAGSAASSAATSDGNPVRIGAAGGSTTDSSSIFKGSIDEVRVWKRALTTQEISDHRNQTLQGTESGLVAYWPFEEGSGTATRDASNGSPMAALGSSTATAPAWVVSDAPLASFKQLVTTATATPTLLVLDASDADTNPLTARILALPAHGRLFQFDAGATGPEITTTGTAVTDSRRRMIYQSNASYTGEDGFLFSVNDGQLDSIPARMVINVLSALTLTSDDLWSMGAGATVISTSPLASSSSAANAIDGTMLATNFADGQAAGFTHFIEWQTPGTVVIDSAKLFADDDGPASAAHGFSEMRLFGRMTGSDPFSLIAIYRPPANPYFGVVQTVLATNSFVGTQFRVEFDAAVVGSGPRVTELDGIGETVAMVASPATVVLQNATASGSQGGFTVGSLIDDVTTGGAGWAGDVGGTPPLTAVFETQQNLGVTVNSEFTFTLPQTYGGVHFLGCFRISATTDDRSQFADGLANSGDVSANWTVLDVVQITGTGGETFQVLGDKSILVSGTSPSATTYTVKAKGITGAVTGFRLEMLENTTLPANGPGRASNGNWVLAEFQVSYQGGLPIANRAPRGTEDALTTDYGASLTSGNLLSNDIDLEGDAISVASFDALSLQGGTVVHNGGGIFTYTPAAGFSGGDSFAYRITDGHQTSAPVTVFITIEPTNVVVWNNPAGGAWITASNWLPARVPTAADIAVIAMPGSYTVTLSSGTQTPLSVSVGGVGATVTLHHTGGTLVPASASFVKTGSRYQLAGGTSSHPQGFTVDGELLFTSGSLDGVGDVRINGTFNWSAGKLSTGGELIVAAGATANFTTAGGKAINRTLRNLGAVNYTGSGLFFNSGAASSGRIENAAGAIWTSDGEGDFTNSLSGTNSFTNAGRFTRRGAGTTTFNESVPFHNTGTVTLEAGTLQLQAGGTLSGSWALAAGSSLILSGGTSTLDSGSEISGEGLVTLGGGTFGAATLTTDVAASIPNFTFSSGTLSGSGAVTLTGAFNWSAGTMSGSGQTIIATGAIGTLNTTSTKNISNSRVLENRGSVVYSGGGLRFGLSIGSSGRIENVAGASFEVQGTAGFSVNSFGSYAFNNAGLLRKTGAGTSSFSGNTVGLINRGTTKVEAGTLQLSGFFTQTSTGATLSLLGGNLSATSLSFASGRVTGFGTISANVTNSGATFSPDATGSRTLTINGTYNQQAGGTLELDLDSNAAGGAFDKLTVLGAATFNGTVSLRSSLALTGEVFPLVTYASRTGTFPTITVANSGSATASYLATRADFTVTAGGSQALAPQLASSYQDWVGLINQTQITLPTQSMSINQNGSTFSGAALPAAGWDNAPTADPDHDGSANILEYAFQTDPLDAASIPGFYTLASQIHPGCIEWTCEMRSNAVDIICSLECSTEPGKWKPLGADSVGFMGITETAFAPGIKKCTLTLNPALAPKKFLRWSVVLKN